MAVLTGHNRTTTPKCNPTKIGGLDSCEFIWNDFERNGYVTAYAEDETFMSTFNYLKEGFKKQPTDHYLRPLMLAAEDKLERKEFHSLSLCLGYQHSADYVYGYAMDFAKTYKNNPYFGLFWTNTFSHNDISDPSIMDKKMLDLIYEMELNGILNNTMIIFFSDHGMRFGPIRRLFTGWLEERTPFIFFSIPSWFKDQHPDLINSLTLNKNRLTSPYDLHMTLKHIVELSGVNETKKLHKIEYCPLCQSLLYSVPWNRSCTDLTILPHWCVCSPYKKMNTKDKNVKLAVNEALNYINDEIKDYLNSNGTIKCAKQYIKSIDSANSATFENYNQVDYLVVFTTQTDGLFEATVRLNTPTNKFMLTGIHLLLLLYSELY